MKATITRPDGTRIEAEGTPEEIAQLAGVKTGGAPCALPHYPAPLQPIWVIPSAVPPHEQPSPFYVGDPVPVAPAVGPCWVGDPLWPTSVVAGRTSVGRTC